MEFLQQVFETARNWIQGIEFANPLVGLAAAVVVAVACLIVMRLFSVVGRRIVARIEASEGTRIKSFSLQQQEILSSEEIAGLLTVIVKGTRFVLSLTTAFVALGVILGFFPWTEKVAMAALRLTLSTLTDTARAIIAYIPNLLLVVVIAAIAWYVVRLSRLVFAGISSERIKIRGFYPEWAMPTFNLVRILVFLFALVMAFPYLPGAGSPAFRGVSIFVGVLFSLGSTSAVANVVAGIVITYMRAFKIGDRVQIADTEGIVIERSLFVTRLRTNKNVEIAVPNSKVLSNHIVNYNAMVRKKGLILHTTVGIGYDVDWRTVHELLIAAARATEGIADDSEPFVHQKELGDFAVTYELNAPTHQPHRLPGITSRLRANILDHFHEAGVEIMSPDFTALRRGNLPAIPEKTPD